jgi:HEAT repeat protein
VTSRNFQVNNLFVQPNPLVVLNESSDGYLRSKALAALREPLQNGGTQKEQDLYVQILTTSATAERDPLCRLAAVRSLGHYKDPRAVTALENAYFQANVFTPETNTILRQQALAALGQTGTPEARELLIRVAREPPVAAEGSELDKQQNLDVRLTAIRALGQFHQYDATETLVQVLKSEKDVALRDRAHEALETATGKHLPAEAQPWEDLLHQTNNPQAPAVAEQPRPWLNLVGWWR